MGIITKYILSIVCLLLAVIFFILYVKHGNKTLDLGLMLASITLSVLFLRSADKEN